MLRVDKLNIHYGKSHVIYDVSIEVKQGEIVTIIGANGAGKTTIMSSIMGLKSVSSGSIFYQNENITNRPPWDRAKLEIGYIPEGRRVFPDLSVQENLRMGCYIVKDDSFINKNLKKVFDYFPRLYERRFQAAKTLSGGEQQMLAIGRAIMLEPKLLLIDEISMGLMPILVNRAIEVIRQMNREGATVLLVEQNAKKALSIANRGYVLETGRIVATDDANELKENAQIKKAYLGG